MNFNYFLPVNIVFGCGRVSETGQLTKPYGTRALIVTGRSSAKKSGLYDRVKDSLHAAGIDSVLFDKVQQNPLTTTAIEGAQFAKASRCDCVVAIGGGSIMDCAKAIAFLAVNDGDINDYIFGKTASDRALPLILIPTTCGTGSEGNGFAVLTNPENGDKKSLRCNAIVAKVSIVDPECMMTMPKKVLAAVGFDALCHCMEAYLSRRHTPPRHGTSGKRLKGHRPRAGAGCADAGHHGGILSRRPRPLRKDRPAFGRQDRRGLRPAAAQAAARSGADLHPLPAGAVGT